MKIAVIGANGQLGNDVVRAFADAGDKTYPLTHSEIEITNLDSICRAFDQIEPEVIVNTAAMHHVESCEREPEQAFAVNALGARNLALAARSSGALIVHISTDYVFDGSKRRPYVETDAPRPLNVYGNTKLAGEHFVQSATERHFVLRTSALYGKSQCRGKGGINFVELMMKLAAERPEIRVVDDEIVTPTFTAELADQIVALSRSDRYGLYHATAEGSCSWYEFAQAILSVSDKLSKLKVAGPNEFPAKVPRPKYSVLENESLKRHGLNRFGHWQDGLSNYLGVSRPYAQGQAL